MKTKSVFFSTMFLILFVSISFAQETTIDTKPTSVFIMPLRPVENYNFILDKERLRLVSMFESLGFNVVQDETTWDKITKFDYDLANLSTKMLNKLSDAVDVDLIVYKNLKHIRVFDYKKNRLLILK